METLGFPIATLRRAPERIGFAREDSKCCVCDDVTQDRGSSHASHHADHGSVASAQHQRAPPWADVQARTPFAPGRELAEHRRKVRMV